MILSTSVKMAFVHALAAVFLAFFGAVYETFSHEVYSYYMIYAFAIPLVLGTLPLLALALREPAGTDSPETVSTEVVGAVMAESSSARAAGAVLRHRALSPDRSDASPAVRRGH